MQPFCSEGVAEGLMAGHHRLEAVGIQAQTQAGQVSECGCAGVVTVDWPRVPLTLLLALGGPTLP